MTTMRQLRRRAGLTIPEAAAAAGVSPEYLRHLEEGLEAPFPDREGMALMSRLARAYGVSTDDVLYAYTFTPPIGPDEPLTPSDLLRVVVRDGSPVGR
jgi:transcriptional regulator with XRE-family HTH domain